MRTLLDFENACRAENVDGLSAGVAARRRAGLRSENHELPGLRESMESGVD